MSFYSFLIDKSHTTIRRFSPSMSTSPSECSKFYLDSSSTSKSNDSAEASSKLLEIFNCFSSYADKLVCSPVIYSILAIVSISVIQISQLVKLFSSNGGVQNIELIYIEDYYFGIFQFIVNVLGCLRYGYSMRFNRPIYELVFLLLQFLGCFQLLFSEKFSYLFMEDVGFFIKFAVGVQICIPFTEMLFSVVCFNTVCCPKKYNEFLIETNNQFLLIFITNSARFINFTFPYYDSTNSNVIFKMLPSIYFASVIIIKMLTFTYNLYDEFIMSFTHTDFDNPDNAVDDYSSFSPDSEKYLYPKISHDDSFHYNIDEKLIDLESGIENGISSGAEIKVGYINSPGNCQNHKHFYEANSNGLNYDVVSLKSGCFFNILSGGLATLYRNKYFPILVVSLFLISFDFLIVIIHSIFS